MTGSTIKTDYHQISETWSAWFKGQKHDPQAAIGYGPTERAAIIDLLDEAEDKMPPDEPAPLADEEITILRWLSAKSHFLTVDSSTDVALDDLAGRGYVTGRPTYGVTDAGRAALKAIEEKRT